MALHKRKITTSQADIEVVETVGTGLPVVLLHGNSSSKEVFTKQLESPLGETYRMIAVDLPGHGGSSDAADPAKVYSMAGYADVVVEVLDLMDIDRAAVVGWSLGGHVALELIPRFPGLAGLMVMATPPLSPVPESLQIGYKPHPLMLLLGKEHLTDEEMEMFLASVYGRDTTPELRAALERSDGRARRNNIETLFDGRNADQKQLAIETTVPLAILNGAEDPIINTDYINSLAYKSLWDRHCFLLRDAGHAAFLTNAEMVNPILERFLGDVSAQAARRPMVTDAKTGTL